MTATTTIGNIRFVRYTGNSKIIRPIKRVHADTCRFIELRLDSPVRRKIARDDFCMMVQRLSTVISNRYDFGRFRTLWNRSIHNICEVLTRTLIIVRMATIYFQTGLENI